MIDAKKMESIFLELLREEIEGKKAEIRKLEREFNDIERRQFVEAAASVIRKMTKVIGKSGMTARMDELNHRYWISDGKHSADFSTSVFNTE